MHDRRPDDREFDLLCRLEREVGPVVDGVSAAPERAPRRNLVMRVALPTAIAAMVLAALAWALPHLPNGAQPIATTTGASNADQELLQLRDALIEAEAAQQVLREELAYARAPQRPVRWYADAALLNYRSPWQPR